MDNRAGPLPTVINSNITVKIEAQDQYESIFSPTQYSAYDSNLQIINKTVKMEQVNECSNKAIGKSCEDIRETKIFVPKVEIKIEFNDEEELTYSEANVSHKKHKIKSEPEDLNDKQEVTDNSHFIAFKENEIKIEISEENEYLDTPKTKINATEASRFESTSPKSSNMNDPVCTGKQKVDNLELNDTKSSKNQFVCDLCDKQFSCKSSLSQHFIKHPKMYNCTSCSYKAFRKSDLERHINSRHTKTTVFNCSYCSHKTYDKDNLKKHINSQHTKGTIFNCSYCSFNTYQRGTLSKHINAKHTKNTVFSCSQCQYKTCYKSNLNKHMNSVHTKSIIFNCSSCSFKTYQKLTLNKHTNAKHTKSTVFSCTDCTFKTSYKECLNRHINTKHSKKIIVSCP